MNESKLSGYGKDCRNHDGNNNKARKMKRRGNRNGKSEINTSSIYSSIRGIGHVDRFLFPPRDPYYLPPMERPVPGRHIDWYVPMMDSGRENMDNQTTIITKGFVPLIRPEMVLHLSGSDVTVVLDSFERRNVEYAARDPNMDLLFPPYISDTECKRVYSFEFDELIHDENYRKLLFETWDNFPNTVWLRGMPHQYGLQYSSIPRNSGRIILRSFNSQNQSSGNNNNNNNSNRLSNNSNENKRNVRKVDRGKDDTKGRDFGSQGIKKEQEEKEEKEREQQAR